MYSSIKIDVSQLNLKTQEILEKELYELISSQIKEVFEDKETIKLIKTELLDVIKYNVEQLYTFEDDPLYKEISKDILKIIKQALTKVKKLI